MNDASESDDRPSFLWMGRGGSVWLEIGDDASHAKLVQIAERLCADFGGRIVERYPEAWSEEGKEYWTVEVEDRSLLLMRKPPSPGVAIGCKPDTTAFLIQVAQKWGVTKQVGWRWVLWRYWPGLLRRMRRCQH